MKTKVHYDIETTLIKGYYPDTINYRSIPEPYIEISDQEHREALGKQMCVVEGALQEYITPDSVLLEQGKASKIAQCQEYLNETGWYVERLNDPSSGKEIPQNILLNRANARTWQNDVQNCTTLGELNNININFN